MPKVLLASYGGAHVRMLVPLIPLLEKAGYEVVPLALTTAPAIYTRLGIAHKRITDFVDAGNAEIMAAAAKLMPKHHNPHAGISTEESIAYLGASYLELEQTVGCEEAAKLCAQRGLFELLPVGLGKSIIQQTRADIVIATCSPRLESALLHAAVELGVPSFCLMALFPLIGMDYLKSAQNGHYIFAGNARFKEQLVAAGRPEAQVKICGNPAFDLLAPSDAVIRRKRLRDARGLSDKDIVILWAEQPEPLQPEWPKKVRMEVAALQQCDGRYVPMIRLHPSSQLGVADALPAGVLISPSTEDATDALLTCDILVTSTSTIGYEALLMDKAVVVVQGSQYDAYADYCERDGALVIKDYRELPQAVQMLSSGSAKAAELDAARRALPKPGHFADDSISLIQQLLKNNPPRQ